MAWLLNQNSEDTALVVLKMPRLGTGDDPETENKIKPIRELLAEYHQRKLADIKRLEKLKRLI